MKINNKEEFSKKNVFGLGQATSSFIREIPLSSIMTPIHGILPGSAR